MSTRGRRARLWFTLLVLALVVGGAAAGVYRLRKVQATGTLPVAQAQRGDFRVMVRCRGEIVARRSVQIYTPNVPQLRIAFMAPAGEIVHEGETIIRFDSSTSQQQLAQKEAQLQQAQAALDQYVAQARITQEQDKSDLADAQYNVEKAKFTVTKMTLKSPVDGEEAKIDQGIAEQKLRVEQATVDLHAAADRSKLASLTRLRDQAKADVELTKSRIAQMELKAPSSGYISYNLNWSGVLNSADAKPYKVGDSVYSGMNLGEIPDLSTLELESNIEETDRGRITAGQDVTVRVDALPELPLAAKVDQISPLAVVSMNEWPPTRSFKATAGIQHPDPRLRPGMNGAMDIVVNRVPNAISIPAKALFTKAGKPVVYVAEGGGYRPVEVKVEAHNPDEVAISGIAPGATVALVDPEKKEQKK
ncbi:MAG TPA: efflux RND transporter periplasmic adaptor subunit [Bryobacteraceae bacterium]|nr:efflux RND transporter periplasmic adaptor subunit [Bryobacteraceae bacterium]